MPARAGGAAVLPATAARPAAPPATWLTPTPPALPLRFPPSSPPPTPGLSNLGNTCFLNAAVQSLLHLAPLSALLAHPSHCRPAAPRPASCALCALQALRTILLESDRVVAPRALASSARAACPGFRTGRQEDAHEFVRGLLAALTRAEVAGCAPRRTQRLTWQMEAASSVHAIFAGTLQSAVSCSRCRHVSTTLEPFLDLSLEISAVSSVPAALARFTAAERLVGDNRWRCSGCKALVDASKRFAIRCAPNVLALHLKRFDRSRKDTRQIRYPATLDLAPYMRGKPDAVNAVYELNAVLIHSGSSPQYGHYYAYVRLPDGGWMLKDDTVSRPVPLQTALRQKAYMLFYTRVPAPEKKQDLASPFLPAKALVKQLVRKDEPRSSPQKKQDVATPQQRQPLNLPKQIPLTPPPRETGIPSAPKSSRSLTSLTAGCLSSVEPSHPVKSGKRVDETNGAVLRVDPTSQATKLPLAQAVSSKLPPALVLASSSGQNLPLPKPDGEGIESARKDSGRSNLSTEPDSKPNFLSPKLSHFSAKKQASKLKAMVIRKVTTVELQPSATAAAIPGDDTDETVLSPSFSSPSPSPGDSDSSREGPPSDGSSSGSGSVRAILIGGTEQVRKVMRRVFGVSQPQAAGKSATSKPAAGQSSPAIGKSSVEKSGVGTFARRRTTGDTVVSEPQPAPAGEFGSTNEVVRSPTPVPSQRVTDTAVRRRGSSAIFKGEGVDVWDTPEARTSERDSIAEATVPRIKKRKRANDELDEEYDRGKAKKVRQRYANWNGYSRSGAGGGARGVRARNAFDIAAERRRGGGSGARW